MNFGFISEDIEEPCICIVPHFVEHYLQGGHNVLVSPMIGFAMGINDDDFKLKGAEICSRNEILNNANVISFFTSNSIIDEYVKSGNKKEMIFIGLLTLEDELRVLQLIEGEKITVYNLNRINKVKEFFRLDVNYSLGLVAGYKAGVMVANMITTSMFFLQNANIEKRRPKVLVIGVGVAGISAANTCRKLGADVIGVDIDSERKNSLERIGAKFIENNSNKDMEDTKLKSKSIDKLISEVDAVICAASYSNRLIPRVLSNEHVKKMKNGAVVIDLAARNGGNYELSTLSERHFENGVSIVSIKNIYKGLPETTSNLISNNYAAFCEMLFSDNIDSIKVADQCDIMTVNGVSNKVYTSTN